MELQSIIDFALNLILILTSVVGGASIIISGLKKIAKVTPTEKDDVFLGKAEKFINAVAVLLDKVALNPTQEKARIAKVPK
ncbi:hypothetical protein VPHD85_0063 [Vibrio phage D85]|nr:hypothetical protein PODOV033v1_p0042 [Vibrio phage 252E42.2]